MRVDEMLPFLVFISWQVCVCYTAAQGQYTYLFSSGCLEQNYFCLLSSLMGAYQSCCMDMQDGACFVVLSCLPLPEMTTESANSTSSSTAPPESSWEQKVYPQALIIVGFFTGAILIGLAIAKVADVIHDHQEARDDVSDISEYTRKTLQVSIYPESSNVWHICFSGDPKKSFFGQKGGFLPGSTMQRGGGGNVLKTFKPHPRNQGKGFKPIA